MTNTLLKGMSANAVTENGAKAYSTTLNHVLDLFSVAGSSRGDDITHKFYKALGEDAELTARLLLWLRDVRGGAGEREQFRKLLKEFITSSEGVPYVTAVINAIPEVGRWDDLLTLVGTKFEDKALEMYATALRENNGLAFKWAPRKDKKGAKALRTYMGFKTEKEWRKFVVKGTNVVETAMCSKNWNSIKFEGVPSLAMARYSNAFNRNAPEKFQEFKDKAVKGEVRVNASAIYPYDVIRTIKNGDTQLADAQWKNLPDFIDGARNILPVIDTSGSMMTTVSGSTQAYDISTSLGLYVSERMIGAFKDHYVTFSSRPNLVRLSGQSITTRFRGLNDIHEGTDLQAVFKLVLDTAVQNKVPQEEMPEKILVISDMQFDDSWQVRPFIYDEVKALYEMAGYELPHLIFWNVCYRGNDTYHAQHTTRGASLISGFSPAILEAVLSGNELPTPTETMLKVLGNPRYAVGTR